MFYITASSEIVKKPRTKQTARMSTGGKAPRKQVPTKDESKGILLQVKNLDESIDRKKLHKIFSVFGEISFCKVSSQI